MLRRYTICTLATMLVCTISYGQSSSALNWYFGFGNGLSFEDGPPKIVTGGQTRMYEGGATYSDPCSGELMFYTDGTRVYDREHQLMPGSAGLTAYSLSPTSSTAQSAIIIPHPGDPDLFYIFNPGNETYPLDTSWPQFNRDAHMHCSYQVVSMSARGGLGDVIDRKVLGMEYHLSEKITAIHDRNKDEYIVVTKTRSTGEFCLWRIGTEGIRETPQVVKPVGIVDSSITGHLKFSPNGRKLVEVDNASRHSAVRIYEFDLNSGLLSNPIYLRTPPECNGYAAFLYGVSFSPDSRMLFTCGAHCGLQQYRVDVHDSAAIAESRYVVDHIDGSRFYEGTLQIGPDRKLYAYNGNYAISCIENPNAYGDDLILRRKVLEFEQRLFSFGLPNFMDQIFDLEYQGDKAIHVEADTAADPFCPGESVQLHASGGDSYIWEPAHLFNDNTLADPIARVPETTCFTVKAQQGDCVAIAGIVVKAHPTEPLNTGEELNICIGESVQLNVEGEGPFEWEPRESLDNPLAKNPTASPSNTTVYRVYSKNDKGCNVEGQVRVNVRQPAAMPFTLAVGDADHVKPGRVTFPMSIEAGSDDLPFPLNSFSVTLSYAHDLLRIDRVAGATLLGSEHRDGRTYVTLEYAARTISEARTLLGNLEFFALLTAQDTTTLTLENFKMDEVVDKCRIPTAQFRGAHYSNAAYCLTYQVVLRQLLRAQLSPNPADEYFELQIQPSTGVETVRIVVFDNMGKVVHDETAATPQGQRTTVRIETANWPSGIYAVRVHSGRSSTTVNLSVVH